MKQNTRDLTIEEKEQLNESINALNKIEKNNSVENSVKSMSYYSELLKLNKKTFSNDILQTMLISDNFDYTKLIANLTPYSYTPELENKISNLEKEINEKENKLKSLFEQLKTEKFAKEELSNKMKEIEESEHELRRRQELVFLTSRIHQEATSVLLEPNSCLLSGFTDSNLQEMAIMSIDIRRSTELMLKAVSPDDYAVFISGLTEQLKSIVIRNYGVFDKFTGDGILAYFPVFYSGETAIYNCLSTANECHELFKKYYEENRSKFSVVIKTGLGIGIDYGKAKLVRLNDEQTVVGTAVVYACRLSSAPHTHTYINQTAYEKIKKLEIFVELNETEIDLKNEGIAIVYDLVSISKQQLVKPAWK